MGHTAELPAYPVRTHPPPAGQPPRQAVCRLVAGVETDSVT
jgi:hypothetical protein